MALSESVRLRAFSTPENDNTSSASVGRSGWRSRWSGTISDGARAKSSTVSPSRHVMVRALTALTEQLTPEERNKIMGHRQGHSRVYVMYYMSAFIDVDCQSICFGSAPQHDLIHLAGRLLCHGDAPTALTDQQKFEVNQDLTLISYRQKRTKAMQQWKSHGFRSREDAEGTEMASRYDHYKKKADRLQQVIQDFMKLSTLRKLTDSLTASSCLLYSLHRRSSTSFPSGLGWQSCSPRLQTYTVGMNFSYYVWVS